MSLPFLNPGLVTGSVLALGLWVVFRLAPRIAPDIRAWSWRLVLLKLAVSAFAIGQVTLHLLPANRLTPAPRPIPSPTVLLQKTTGFDAPRVLEKIGTSKPIRFANTVMHKAQEHPRTNPKLLIFGIWAAGIALLFVRALFVTIRTRRDLRDATLVTNPEIIRYLETISKRAGLRRPPRLVSMESAQSPMVYGIWRPIIVLPTRLASSSSGDVELAVGHEIAHIRRGDLIWTAVAWLVRSILFFNPVAWLADSELRASQESATDQEAVWITGASVAAYAKMLLSSMSPERVAWQRSGLAMFDSFVCAQRRLRAMQQFSPRPKLTQKVMVAVLLIAGFGCLPSYTLVRVAAAAQPQQKSASDPWAPTGGIASKTETDAHAKGGSSHPAEHIPKLNSKSNVRTAPGLMRASTNPIVTTKNSHLTSLLAHPSKLQPDVQFVEEQANVSAPPESDEFKQASKAAAEAYNARVSKLIADQDTRIAEYRVGADERERGAEEREREGQQRKRDGEQRARAALLREQVIEEHERNNYQFVEHGQREADARIRRDDARQQAADRYQGVLDQRQRETDQWQRNFDEKSVSAMRKETQADIAAARSQYQKRISELVADEASRHREAKGAAAYTETQAKLKTASGLHTVRTESGLSFAIPDGYDVVRVQTIGKDAYTVVLKHKKS
jgi:beta-lactamase regulating signal transducer with metallopeptidase domain